MENNQWENSELASMAETVNWLPVIEMHGADRSNEVAAKSTTAEIIYSLFMFDSARMELM